MSKIPTIISREYLTRVKKKSFLIMTFLTPVLLIGLMVLPYLVQKNNKGEKQYYAVVDKKGNLHDAFVDNDMVSFNYFRGTADSVQSLFKTGNYDGIVYIPEDYIMDSVAIYSANPVPLGVKSAIQMMLNSYIERQNLVKQNIDPLIIEGAKVKVPLKTLQLSKNGEIEKSSSELNTAIGFIGAIIIYMFIFTYGAMVMKGAMEEKKGRVVEILVSSVKSFEMMMGKIIGIALVAFTQFGIWLITLIGFIFIARTSFPDVVKNMSGIFEAMHSINFGAWLGMFIFYFIGGYLLYGSLFGAIGAAVDNDTDTQQFMLPITIPLILAFAFAQSIIQNPSGDLAVWLSIIPFTSPVLMVVRFGFGVPAWQVITSALVLIATFILTVWLAAKIYRVGILSYGKKVTYREMWKWIRYKG